MLTCRFAHSYSPSCCVFSAVWLKIWLSANSIIKQRGGWRETGPPSFNLCSIANSVFVLQKLIVISLSRFLSLKGGGFYVVRPSCLTLYVIFQLAVWSCKLLSDDRTELLKINGIRFFSFLHTFLVVKSAGKGWLTLILPVLYFCVWWYSPVPTLNDGNFPAFPVYKKKLIQ